MLGFTGYAIYILLGGTVSLYLQLRKEVDGADESEIYPPLEEDELDVSSEGTEPRWVGAGESAPDEGSDAEPPEQEDAEEAQEPDDEVGGEDREDKEPEG
jgi:hypothetical protein